MKNKSIILLCTLFIFIATSAQITKKSVLDQLDAQSEKYGAIAMKIWNLAEMGYLEKQSSSLLQQTLSNEGFTIKKRCCQHSYSFHSRIRIWTSNYSNSRRI